MGVEGVQRRELEDVVILERNQALYLREGRRGKYVSTYLQKDSLPANMYIIYSTLVV